MAETPERRPRGKWARIEAEYRAGASVVALHKKYGVYIKDILDRVRDEGWERDPPETADESAAPRLMSLPVPVRTERPAEEEETVEDVKAGHKAILNRKRAILDGELAQLQKLTFYMTGVDHETVQAFIDSADAKGLVDYLMAATKARKLVADLIEKHARSANLIIETERRVWGINEKDGDGTAQTYDALLEELRQPIDVPTLPDKVIDFERRLAARR